MKRWKPGLNIGPRIGHYCLNEASSPAGERADQPTFSGWFQCLRSRASQMSSRLGRFDQGGHGPHWSNGWYVCGRHLREHLGEQPVGPALDDPGLEPRNRSVAPRIRCRGRAASATLLADAGEDLVGGDGLAGASAARRTKAFSAVDAETLTILLRLVVELVRRRLVREGCVAPVYWQTSGGSSPVSVGFR
jgi:hypothetical protein